MRGVSFVRGSSFVERLCILGGMPFVRRLELCSVCVSVMWHFSVLYLDSGAAVRFAWSGCCVGVVCNGIVCCCCLLWDELLAVSV